MNLKNKNSVFFGQQMFERWAKMPHQLYPPSQVDVASVAGALQDFMGEVTAMTALNHPNLVRLYGEKTVFNSMKDHFYKV